MLTIPNLRKLVKTADIFVNGIDKPFGSRTLYAKEYFIDDYDDAGFTISNKETEEQFFINFRDVTDADSFK